mmetsp:Transcript_27906/g.95191  ORF Transcript_27906/g.95191 Transcript_27906/m.95191 type:complete len:255 (-) Transcript_27906:456-1220(-)
MHTSTAPWNSGAPREGCRCATGTVFTISSTSAAASITGRSWARASSRTSCSTARESPSPRHTASVCRSHSAAARRHRCLASSSSPGSIARARWLSRSCITPAAAACSASGAPSAPGTNRSTRRSVARSTRLSLSEPTACSAKPNSPWWLATSCPGLTAISHPPSGESLAHTLAQRSAASTAPSAPPATDWQQLSTSGSSGLTASASSFLLFHCASFASSARAVRRLSASCAWAPPRPSACRVNCTALSGPEPAA